MSLRLATALSALAGVIAGQLASAAPIHDAVAAGNLAQIGKILTADAQSVNAKGPHGYRPLHIASKEASVPRLIC